MGDPDEDRAQPGPTEGGAGSPTDLGPVGLSEDSADDLAWALWWVLEHLHDDQRAAAWRKCADQGRRETWRDPVTGAEEIRWVGGCNRRDCPICHAVPWRRRREATWTSLGDQPHIWTVVATVPRSPRYQKRHRPETASTWLGAVVRAVEDWCLEWLGFLPPISCTPHYSAEEDAWKAVQHGRRIEQATHYNLVIGSRGLVVEREAYQAEIWRNTTTGRRARLVTRYRRVPVWCDLEEEGDQRGPAAIQECSELRFDRIARPDGTGQGEALADLKARLGRALCLPRRKWQAWASYRKGPSRIAHTLRYHQRSPGEGHLRRWWDQWPAAQRRRAEAAVAEARARLTPSRVNLVRPGGAIPAGGGGAELRKAYLEANPQPPEVRRDRRLLKIIRGTRVQGSEYLADLVEVRDTSGRAVAPPRPAEPSGWEARFGWKRAEKAVPIAGTGHRPGYAARMVEAAVDRRERQDAMQRLWEGIYGIPWHPPDATGTEP